MSGAARHHTTNFNIQENTIASTPCNDPNTLYRFVVNRNLRWSASRFRRLTGMASVVEVGEVVSHITDSKTNKAADSKFPIATSVEIESSSSSDDETEALSPWLVVSP